jgi:beta-lactamase superfamily II metal-dependent hydrolase
VESGTTTQPRYILIDGGPSTTYERHLRGELQAIAASGGSLELAILSHVDKDHVTGLLDLTAELRQQRADGEEGIVAINTLWHNAFEDTIGSGNDIEVRLQEAISAAGAASQALTSTGMATQGIGEGRQLRRDALLLQIPINPEFGGASISVEDAPPSIQMDNLTLRVVGPTQKNLQELRDEWQEWLDTHADDIVSGDPLLAAMADRSTPNLSSIMLLAEADGKTLLLTGDGRGDHLLEGLEQAGLLDAEGKLHVDVFKVPHHGSDRNATRRFFETVTANQYVISANGRHNNPDLATLIWIVEAAKEQQRTVEILVTNETTASRKLVEEYDPDEYGYELTTMGEDAHSMVIELAAGA